MKYKITVKRILLLLLAAGATLTMVVGAFILYCFRDRNHPTDRLTLQNGQTTVVKLTCPAENFQWRGAFRRPDAWPSVPPGQSQIVMRLKNEDSEDLEIDPMYDKRESHFAPGETKEVFRGSLEDLLTSGKLEFLSLKRSDAHVDLQIDSTFPQEQPVRVDIWWNYIHYGM